MPFRKIGWSTTILMVSTKCERGPTRLTRLAVTEWVNSSYAYRPASAKESSGNTTVASAPYVQDSLALAILKKFYDFNSSKLDQITIPTNLAGDNASSDTLGGCIKPWTTTSSIDMEKGAQEMLTWVFEVIRSQDQIPMLITLDGVNSLFRDSLYNTEIGQPIPAPNLGVPRLFLEYMTGRKTMVSEEVLSLE